MQMAELQGNIYKKVNASGSTSWQLQMRFDGYYVNSGVVTKTSYSLEYIEELRRVLSEKHNERCFYEEAVEFMKTYPESPERPCSMSDADTARITVGAANQPGQLCLYIQKPLKNNRYTSPRPLRQAEFGLFYINRERVYIYEFDFKQLPAVIPVRRVTLNDKTAWVQSDCPIPEHPRWREIKQFYKNEDISADTLS